MVCGVLVVCAIAFVVGTIHWRQVNDAAQISYACFMMDHGMSPYKDLVEMNMPGIYIVNWSVMHGLGDGSLAWRVFDLSLTGIGVLAMVVISMPYDWLAGVFGGVLFALFHGRDGPAQAGQRDLIIAVLFLWAVAFTFESIRRNRLGLLFFSGFCAAAATTIKPTAILFPLFLLAAICVRERMLDRPVTPGVAWSVAGAALPLAGVYLFLRAEGSLSAFWYVLRRMLPFYAHLGRIGMGYLVLHCLTPSLLVLLLLALSTSLIERGGWSWTDGNWERLIVFAGVLFGALSYFAQGTGFPYHRYPMLAFLFLWISLQFARTIRSSGTVRYVALAGVLLALVLAPLYTARARQRTWDESYNNSLRADLDTLGGSNLSGKVLCLATPGDCDTTLYRLKLVQDSGLFYDYFVFGNGSDPVIQRTRQRVLPVLFNSPPRVIILDRGLYPNKADAYGKLETWPDLDRFIGSKYMMYIDREFSSAESGQRGYRLYVLNQPNALPDQSKLALTVLPSAR